MCVCVCVYNWINACNASRLVERQTNKEIIIKLSSNKHSIDATIEIHVHKQTNKYTKWNHIRLIKSYYFDFVYCSTTANIDRCIIIFYGMIFIVLLSIKPAEWIISFCLGKLTRIATVLSERMPQTTLHDSEIT